MDALDDGVAVLEDAEHVVATVAYIVGDDVAFACHGVDDILVASILVGPEGGVGRQVDGEVKNHILRAAFGSVLSEAVDNVAAMLAHIVGVAVNPGVGIGGADDIVGVGSVVHCGEVDCLGAVATVLVGTNEVLGVVAGSVVGLVVPYQAVASHFGALGEAMVVNGEDHGDDAVAALSGSEGLDLVTALGVGDAIPLGAVADHAFERGGCRIVDREVEDIQNRAVTGDVEVADIGSSLGHIVLHVLAFAEGEGGTLAELTIAVLDSSVEDGEGEVDDTVAAVSDGEGLVVESVGAELLSAEQVGQVLLAVAGANLHLVARMDSNSGVAELADAAVLVGDGDGGEIVARN